MTGRIDFHYDVKNDIVIATPHWHLQTDEDVRSWFAQYEAYLKPFGRKMDFIVVLDDFEIATTIGSFWGHYRAKLLNDFARLNFRVRAPKKVRLFVNTSGVLHGIATEEAASVDEAVRGILGARSKAGLGRAASSA